MATYEATPILATEKALTLLNSEKAESLTPESRKEQREYHQNQLNQLKEQEQVHIPVKMNTQSGKREHLRSPKHCLS
ncbi:hypothetical protein ACH42_00325 [Endozoicomonas sp. (ex Bugula neritina AB1)]|nr:hypothetical protein ACH42_00325 [Endozoicomonas sp. (ex Bugula neritina AB1)]